MIVAKQTVWKRRIIAAQGNRCLLCDAEVALTERSWDHLVPQVYSSEESAVHRLGCVFLTHRSCNGARGHQQPLDIVIKRAARVILSCGAEDQFIAQSTIKRALAEHEDYVSILGQLIAEMKEGATQ